MPNEPTVLVLGAGASMPYGFPSGRGLKLDICKGLSNSHDALAEKLNQCGYSFEELYSFRDELKYSMQPSVDAFLENRKEFVNIGKAAIAAQLIPLEKKNLLCPQDKQEWYEYLFQEICPGDSEFKNSHLSVITFNYDRSLDHFLFIAVRCSFGFSESEAASFVKCVPIIHVHGQLGSLPYLGNGGRNYEPDSSIENIKLAASQIRIVHETSPEDTEFVTARDKLWMAKRVCFLGFGYHAANVERLGFYQVPTVQPGGRELIGSAYKMLEAEKSRARELFKGNIRLGSEDDDALKFLRRETVLR
jgi:hypothetical protein